MEIQKTSNSQSNLEEAKVIWKMPKKHGTGGINLPDFRLYNSTKPQSSRQYGTGTKTEI